MDNFVEYYQFVIPMSVVSIGNIGLLVLQQYDWFLQQHYCYEIEVFLNYDTLLERKKNKTNDTKGQVVPLRTRLGVSLPLQLAKKEGSWRLTY